MAIVQNGISNWVSTTPTVQDPFMVWNTYEYINSAVSAASNHILINGVNLPLDKNFVASGFSTVVNARSLNVASTNIGSDIAEILIYNSEITDAQRKVVENYLAYKWGVPYPPAY